MNKFILLVSMTALVGCSSSREWSVMPGQHPQRFEREITIDARYDLLVYTPEAYDPSRRWPLIVFLHGSGERGSDPNLLKVHSLPKLAETRGDLPFIIVSPQCPEGERWNAVTLNAMLDDVIARMPVDTTRIYLTGLSMGGYGAWKFAIASPERFAAVAPVCGWGHLEDVEKLKKTPVWVFHGAQDDVVPPSESEKMVAFLKKHGSSTVRYTLCPDADHNAWDRTYANPELYEWFLQHTK